MSLPPDLQRILDGIDAADRGADEIAARVSDEEFGWQPEAGRRWSIAQCLDHLAATNVLYGAAVRSGIEQAKARGWVRRAPAVPGFFGRRFIATQEPPVKMKTKAPDRVQPKPRRSREEILRAYHDAHDEVRRLIKNAAEIDTNRATFKNPFFPLFKVSVSTGLHVIAAHDRRHLWQAAQIEKQLPART